MERTCDRRRSCRSIHDDSFAVGNTSTTTLKWSFFFYNGSTKWSLEKILISNPALKKVVTLGVPFSSFSSLKRRNIFLHSKKKEWWLGADPAVNSQSSSGLLNHDAYSLPLRISVGGITLGTPLYCRTKWPLDRPARIIAGMQSWSSLLFCW